MPAASPGGCVMDLFCGSGTAAVAAHSCSFVASDASAFAQNALRKRLLQRRIVHPLYLPRACVAVRARPPMPRTAMELCLLGWARARTRTRAGAARLAGAARPWRRCRRCPRPGRTRRTQALQNLTALDVISAGRLQVPRSRAARMCTAAHPALIHQSIHAGRGVPCRYRP